MFPEAFFKFLNDRMVFQQEKVGWAGTVRRGEFHHRTADTFPTLPDRGPEVFTVQGIYSVPDFHGRDPGTEVVHLPAGILVFA